MSVNQSSEITSKKEIHNHTHQTQCQVTCNYKIAKIIIPKPPVFNIKQPPNPSSFLDSSDLNDFDRQILSSIYQFNKPSRIQNGNCVNVKKYISTPINLGNNVSEFTTINYSTYSYGQMTSFNEVAANSNKNSLIKDSNLFLILLMCCVLLITILVIFVFLYYYLNRKPRSPSNHKRNSNDNSLTKSSSTTLISQLQLQPQSQVHHPHLSTCNNLNNLNNQYNLTEFTFVPINNSHSMTTTSASSYEYCTTKNLFKKLINANDSSNAKNYDKLEMDTTTYYNTINNYQVNSSRTVDRNDSFKAKSELPQFIQIVQQTNPNTVQSSYNTARLLANIYENNNDTCTNNLNGKYQQMISADLNCSYQQQQAKCFIYLNTNARKLNDVNTNIELNPLFVDSESMFVVEPVTCQATNGPVYDRIDEEILVESNMNNTTPVYNRSNTNTISSSNKRKYPKTNPNYRYV